MKPYHLRQRSNLVGVCKTFSFFISFLQHILFHKPTPHEVIGFAVEAGDSCSFPIRVIAKHNQKSKRLNCRRFEINVFRESIKILHNQNFLTNQKREQN